jgi:hypothetical protein
MSSDVAVHSSMAAEEAVRRSVEAAERRERDEATVSERAPWLPRWASVSLIRVLHRCGGTHVLRVLSIPRPLPHRCSTACSKPSKR